MTGAKPSPGSSWGQQPGRALTVAAPDHTRDDDAPAEPVRCRVCHRPVVAPESVRAELGPVCRFALAQRLTRAAGAPVVLGERDGELLAWIGRAP